MWQLKRKRGKIRKQKIDVAKDATVAVVDIFYFSVAKHNEKSTARPIYVACRSLQGTKAAIWPQATYALQTGDRQTVENHRDDKRRDVVISIHVNDDLLGDTNCYNRNAKSNKTPGGKGRSRLNEYEKQSASRPSHSKFERAVLGTWG
ncbi:hypothetical protein OUZ56_005151 [Daphnia magna]|uniref:Uncharacterized protein n=1 Tax=Daphnia magna TaxID=35525 RepID=A0ABQ9YS29_9CRUS|nr:hypothetical protein OUZ56_005151 [Daphnia magna]